MKKTNHFYRFCALALSCLLLISLLPVTQVLADGDGAIHIKSAEDLRSLAHSCTLDSWSRGKTVVLDNDIELTDDDELPIPTFGGTFNGNGHTISGLSITQSVSPAGLFGVLQKDAVIKNLNVEGTVTPSGDSENIGGIVGENHGTIESCTFNGSVSGKRSVGGIAGSNLATGIVRACDASGAIFGQSMTGGIVGENLGSIVSCRGRAYVNIESTDPSIDLSNLNLEFSLDLAKLSRADTLSPAGSQHKLLRHTEQLVFQRRTADIADQNIHSVLLAFFYTVTDGAGIINTLHLAAHITDSGPERRSASRRASIYLGRSIQ